MFWREVPYSQVKPFVRILRVATQTLLKKIFFRHPRRLAEYTFVHQDAMFKILTNGFCFLLLALAVRRAILVSRIFIRGGHMIISSHYGFFHIYKMVNISSYSQAIIRSELIFRSNCFFRQVYELF